MRVDRREVELSKSLAAGEMANAKDKNMVGELTQGAVWISQGPSRMLSINYENTVYLYGRQGG